MKSLKLLVITVAMVFGAIAMPDTANSANDKVSFRLDWRLTGYHVPFYWAQSKGYYAAENLDVEIKEGAGSGKTVNLVGSGQDDLGFADYMIMAASASKGMKAKAIFSVVQDGAWAVISHKEDAIMKPKDLLNRSVASVASHKALLDLFMDVNGIDKSAVTVRVTNGSTRNTTFDQDKVDSMISISIGSPMDFVVRAKNGTSKPVHFMPFAKFGLAHYGQGIIANTEFLASKPDVVRRFIAATSKAFKESSKPENHAEGANIAVSLSKSSTKRLESVKLQWAATLGHTGTSNTQGKPIGWMSEKDWTASLGILKKTGRLTREMAPNEVFTNQFISN